MLIFRWLSRNLFSCLHLEMNSDLLFESKFCSGKVIMAIFLRGKSCSALSYPGKLVLFFLFFRLILLCFYFIFWGSKCFQKVFCYVHIFIVKWCLVWEALLFPGAFFCNYIFSRRLQKKQRKNNYSDQKQHNHTRIKRTTTTRKQKWDEKQPYGYFKRKTSEISHKKTCTQLRKGNQETIRKKMNLF